MAFGFQQIFVLNAIAFIHHTNACSAAVDNCEDYNFKDWTSSTFNVGTKEKCIHCIKIFFSDICWESACIPSNLNIYDSAKESLIQHHGWNMTECFNKYELKCSGPAPNDLVQRGLIQATERDTYERYQADIFHEGCKIHDMCYRNSDIEQKACDDDFRHNLEQICRMRHPKGQAIAKKGHCLMWAQIFYSAVRLGGEKGSQHWSGKECMSQGE